MGGFISSSELIMGKVGGELGEKILSELTGFTLESLQVIFALFQGMAAHQL